MAITAGFSTSTRSSLSFLQLNLNRSSASSSTSAFNNSSNRRHFSITTNPANNTNNNLLKCQSNSLNLKRRNPSIVVSSGGNNNNNGGGGSNDNGGGSGGGDGDNGNSDDENEKNKAEAMLVLSAIGRSLDSIPSDLASAIVDGKIPASIVHRYLNLEKSSVFKWLLQFGGFKERLLADDLFLAKMGMECGVGIFTKTAAEYERRRENFMKELDFVVADVAMAIIADFMLVWLPAPTVSLRPSLSVNAGSLAKFFHSCPDNAFQIALGGTSYSFIQRLASIMRNGAKLFAVGTTASLVGTAATNALIKARKTVNKSSEGEVEEIPIVATSVAYGVYMAVSSNLRYQLLAGVVEQRILEPMLHQHKLLLSALCFAVRTGNTFLGSLLWVDYARLIGIQKVEE